MNFVFNLEHVFPVSCLITLYSMVFNLISEHVYYSSPMPSTNVSGD